MEKELPYGTSEIPISLNLKLTISKYIVKMLGSFKLYMYEGRYTFIKQLAITNSEFSLLLKGTLKIYYIQI